MCYLSNRAWLHIILHEWHLQVCVCVHLYMCIYMKLSIKYDLQSLRLAPRAQCLHFTSYMYVTYLVYLVSQTHSAILLRKLMCLLHKSNII